MRTKPTSARYKGAPSDPVLDVASEKGSRSGAFAKAPAGRPRVLTPRAYRSTVQIHCMRLLAADSFVTDRLGFDEVRW